MIGAGQRNPHRAHSVLVVEDNDDVRESLARVLLAHGFDAAPAWSGEDALRHFRQGYRPCVVVLDLRMPGMDGWSFLDRMREEPEGKDVPVIVVTALANERAAAEERGVAEFFVKPAKPDALVAAVTRNCARRD
jgi:CheY-like chemotaxis protein